MNKERLAEVATAIEVQPALFNQGTFGVRVKRSRHECMTPACIAGWAFFLYADPDKEYDLVEYSAPTMLGLNQDEAGFLFNVSWPFWWTDPGVTGDDIRRYMNFEDVDEYDDDGDQEMIYPSADDAVKVLRRLADVETNG